MGFSSRRRQRLGKWKGYCEFLLTLFSPCCRSLSLVNKFYTIKNQYPEEETRQVTHFPTTVRFFFIPPSPSPTQKTKMPIDLIHSSLRLHRQKGDLAQLSAEGHFLKGSSATLGLNKVKDSCEKIQHYGQHKDETGTNDEPDDAKCLGRIKKTLDVVKVEYAEVEKVLRRFYHEHV